MHKVRTAAPAPRPGGAPKPKSTGRQYAQSLLVAVLLALFFRQLVVQAFHIPSSSMEQTLLIGDFLFVNKFLYGAQIPFTGWRLPAVRPPRRGDIIVFKSYDGRDFIKRCVAVAGDTVEVRAKELYLNGRLQTEAHAQHIVRGIMLPRTSPRDYFGPRVIGPDSIFMMGDNRDNSEDSRFWGPLAIGRVRGKAIFIYFSGDKSRRYPFSFYTRTLLFMQYEGYFPPRIRWGRIGRIIH